MGHKVSECPNKLEMVILGKKVLMLTNGHTVVNKEVFHVTTDFMIFKRDKGLMRSSTLVSVC